MTTQKWLLPIDGSETALHAVAWAIAHATELRESPQILLINVQATLPKDIGRFINVETLREFHLDTG
ncbi:MAG: universal stress protein, partial [Sulfuritalea sp.]|nr:universal stress protein [Sulfuritalea sp.]